MDIHKIISVKPEKIISPRQKRKMINKLRMEENQNNKIKHVNQIADVYLYK